MKTDDRSASDFTAQGIRKSRIGRSVGSFLAAWQASSGRTGRLRVVAACSGGPDSTALLIALWALRDELAFEVHVVCVDHQLRPVASAEAALVVEVAQRLGLSAERIAVSCPPGPSKMAVARTARYDALALAAQRFGADAVLVAHTQQDQTETMLMRWLAGAGLLGLCGMEAERSLPVPESGPAPAVIKPAALVSGPVVIRPTASVTILRPLLTTSRAEIEAFLTAEAALVTPLPLHDPSNRDRHYQRSRLRHDLLPQLRQEQPQLDDRLTQLAAQLRDDSDYLEQQAETTYQALRSSQSTDGARCTTLPLAATAALPPALFARVIMRASGGGLGQPHITAVRSLCGNTQGTQALDLPGGRRVERRYAELCFLSPAAPRYSTWNQPPEQSLPGCGHYAFWHGTLDLQWDSQPSNAGVSPGSPDANAPSAAGQLTGSFHEARLLLPPAAFPLTLRAPRPGDRIRINDSGGHRKVSDLLIDRKVARFVRAGIALLCRGEQILWVIGHRVAAPLIESGATTAPARALIARFVPDPGNSA